MGRYDLATKQEAVDFALRRLVGPVLKRDEMLAIEGIGWEGDLSVLSEDAAAPL